MTQTHPLIDPSGTLHTDMEAAKAYLTFIRSDLPHIGPHRAMLSRLDPSAPVQAWMAAHPTAQHLGVTDPYLCALLALEPRLEGPLCYEHSGVRFGFHGPALVFQVPGSPLQRPEHDPDLAEALWHLAPKSSSGPHPLRMMVLELTDDRSLAAHVLWPQLHLADRQSDETIKDLIRGGYRHRALLRLALPDAPRAVRAAVHQLLETPSLQPHSKIRGLRHVASTANQLCQAGRPDVATFAVEQVATGKVRSGQDLESLTYLIRQHRYPEHPQLPRMLGDSLNMVTANLAREDLYLLGVTLSVPRPGDASPEALTQLHDDLTQVSLSRTLISQHLKGERNFNLPLIPDERQMVLSGHIASGVPLTIRVTAAATAEELHGESRDLRHCVGYGGYAQMAAQGHIELYLIREITPDGERPLLTAEIGGGFLKQLRGLGNRAATPDERELLRHWTNRIGLRDTLPQRPAAVQADPAPQRTRFIAEHQAETDLAALHLQAQQEAGLSPEQVLERTRQASRQLRDAQRILERANAVPHLVILPNRSPLRRHLTEHTPQLEQLWTHAEAELSGSPLTLLITERSTALRRDEQYTWSTPLSTPFFTEISRCSLDGHGHELLSPAAQQAVWALAQSLGLGTPAQTGEDLQAFLQQAADQGVTFAAAQAEAFGPNTTYNAAAPRHRWATPAAQLMALHVLRAMDLTLTPEQDLALERTLNGKTAAPQVIAAIQTLTGPVLAAHPGQDQAI